MPPLGQARRGAALLNLHHDRNDAKPRRVVTVIVYLSDVEGGGGTYFPLARPVAEAAPPEAAVRERASAASAVGNNAAASASAADGRGGGGACGSAISSGGKRCALHRRESDHAAALSEAFRAIYDASDGGMILPTPAGCALTRTQVARAPLPAATGAPALTRLHEMTPDFLDRSELMTLREAAALAVVEAGCAAAAAERGCELAGEAALRGPMWVYGRKGGLLVRPVKARRRHLVSARRVPRACFSLAVRLLLVPAATPLTQSTTAAHGIPRRAPPLLSGR